MQRRGNRRLDQLVSASLLLMRWRRGPDQAITPVTSQLLSTLTSARDSLSTA
jgi:hypothetical protein